MVSRHCGICSLLALALSHGVLGQQGSPDVRRYLPAGADVQQQMALKPGTAGTDELALVYAVPDPADRAYHTSGVRVLRYSAADGWTTRFDEQTVKLRGADAMRLEKLQAPNGAEALLVIASYSGAGTATSWHVLAFVGGKTLKLDPTQAKAKVLRRRGYQDWGYNSVSAKGNYVVEKQPGYSHQAARCCPDRPTIEMLFKFTGSSILLERVSARPFTPSQ